jgi:peptide/nickel transport system substrate-binding protein
MAPGGFTAGQFTLLSSMTAPNDLTVVFHYSKAFPGLPYVLAEKNGCIAAPSYLAKVAAGQTTATPIGAGPFKVASFYPGVSISLVKNTNYFAGAPYLDGLKFVYIDSGGTNTYQAFQSGQIQAFETTSYAVQAMAKSGGFPMFSQFQAGGNGFELNALPGKPFSNAGLKVAVQDAVDANLQEINTGLFNGTATMSPYVFPKGTGLNSTDVPVPKESLAAEQQAVTAAKAALHWNGTLMIMCGNSPSAANEPTALEAILKPLGIDFTVSLVSTAQEINAINITHTGYDIACFGNGIGDFFPYISLNQFYSSAVAGPQIGYANPQMDALIAELETDATVSAEDQTLAKVQKLWFQTVPYLPVAPGNDALISVSNLHGLVHSDTVSTFFDKAWLS